MALGSSLLRLPTVCNQMNYCSVMKAECTAQRKMMKYKVFVDDNFHYMDESERYLKGEYETLEEAIEVAKKIVDDFLDRGKGDFDNADALHASYRGYGEDPYIMPGDGGVPFSAWSYARERCDQIFSQDDCPEPIGDEEEDCDDSNELDYEGDYFPFRAGERWFTDELKKLIRELIVKEADSPETIRDLSLAAHAINRLPWTTTGINLELGIIYRFNNESSYCEIEISDERLAISDGGNTSDPGFGSDSYSNTIIEMEALGFREGLLDPWSISSWFSSFRELIEMSAVVEISNYADNDDIKWESFEGDPWEVYERQMSEDEYGPFYDLD